LTFSFGLTTRLFVIEVQQFFFHAPNFLLPVGRQWGERRRERLTPSLRKTGEYGIVELRFKFNSYFEKFSYLLLKNNG
jgi:hypothetical protein